MYSCSYIPAYVQNISSGADKVLKWGRMASSHTLGESYRGALKGSFVVRVTNMLGKKTQHHDILCLKHEIMIQDTWIRFLALPVTFCTTTGSHWMLRQDWSVPVYLSCLPRPWALWNRNYSLECVYSPSTSTGATWGLLILSQAVDYFTRNCVQDMHLVIHSLLWLT